MKEDHNYLRSVGNVTGTGNITLDSPGNKPVDVLRECIHLINDKGAAYQNSTSSVRQADYYPRGVASILEIVDAKRLRIRSIMEACEQDPDFEPNFESLDDSLKDLINYASFAVSWLRGGIHGQKTMEPFNRQ